MSFLTTAAERPASALTPIVEIDPKVLLAGLPSDLNSADTEFLKSALPPAPGGGVARPVVSIDDVHAAVDSENAGLLLGRVALNKVRRLDQYLGFCTQQLEFGGYLLVRYVPLEFVTAGLRRYGVLFRPVKLLHYLWYRAMPKIPVLDRVYSANDSWVDKVFRRRNRMLSKAEVWGRLSYWGLDVVTELRTDSDALVLARRMSPPTKNRRPSYYPVVALEKVALDGEIIRMHKIRTMYPFSEFIQKRIFQDHGLTATGKFANDFRLTALGKFMRRYWLDEVPQLFDWLRGDIKLVGIRATSRHFLNLYPKHFLDYYLQIKPGLIPPIFDESTQGFDQIVDVELKYLKSYWTRPFATDVDYFLQTLRDIFFRGVRSK
jgi:lipopolysaccharide/colanic/teichoic acid biosynthesis glycosyltransferase